ncbi:MAG: hypothetical protein ACYC92_08620 [Candidatus Acidiferrales bacterium]
MPTVYLFQFDGAVNNDIFFDALSTALDGLEPCRYKGITFTVGGWTPDGARVDVGKSQCSLTLIELEDTKSEARKSCRKYLPESSIEIVKNLAGYLDRVLRSCRSTNDPREQRINRLKLELFSEHMPITVKTACALRDGTEIVEEFLLIDQPRVKESQPALASRDGNSSREQLPPLLHGILSLDSGQVRALGRSILILDSIIRGKDLSSATFHSWRNKAPLKRSLKGTSHSPILLKLLYETTSGMRVNQENLRAELISHWGKGIDVWSLVVNYFPIASRIKNHELMNDIFHEARKYVQSSEARRNDSIPP